MIVVRLHGVSPESTKAVMVQYGDVLDADIGYISKKLLPGVTNGTWTVKMILHEGKVLPSFVFMKEEGEVWQVTHENQVNVCWKCGLVGHVGAKCHQPTLTFDALDGVQTVAEGDGGVGGAGSVKSWAHVVRSGSCQSTSVSVSQSELVKQENLMRKLKDQEIRKLEQAAADKALTEKVDEVAADESADNALVVEEQVAEQDASANMPAALQVVPDSLAISQDDQFAAQQKVFSRASSDQIVHDRDSSEDASESESGDSELALSMDKVKSRNKRQLKKLRSNPVEKFSEANLDGSHSVKLIPHSVKGVTPMVESDQATSKAGMTPHSQVSCDQDFNSQATSKAGLSQESGFDPNLTASSEGFGLKKIVPSESASQSSSGDSSPRHHKEAAVHLDSSEENSDLPGNIRSVANRGLKAQLRENFEQV